SFVRLVYQPKPYQPNLARFPFPFVDELGYGTTEIDYVAPSSLSPESLEALGVVATRLGQSQGWRPMHPVLTTDASVNQNVVLVGTPQENSAISQIESRLPISISQAQGDDGLIALVPNPSHPDKAILVVTGNTPAGVAKAAHFLVQNPSNK